MNGPRINENQDLDFDIGLVKDLLQNYKGPWEKYVPQDIEIDEYVVQIMSSILHTSLSMIGHWAPMGVEVFSREKRDYTDKGDELSTTLETLITFSKENGIIT